MEEKEVTEGKLKVRVAALEDAVKFLLKGAKNVQAEFESEWAESPYGSGNHLGIELTAED